MFASPANRIDSLRCGNSLVSGSGLRLSFGDDLWFRLKQYLPTRKLLGEFRVRSQVCFLKQSATDPEPEVGRQFWNQLGHKGVSISHRRLKGSYHDGGFEFVKLGQSIN